MRSKRHMIGRYGAGTLWCLTDKEGTFVLFNAMKIAKRSRSGWDRLDKGWKITSLGDSEIRVQLNDSVQFGRTSAPTVPHFVQTIFGPKDGTVR